MNSKGVCAYERHSRTLTGAWIEMSRSVVMSVSNARRTLTGAWIEIPSKSQLFFAALCRTLTGAWIEIMGVVKIFNCIYVAPSRVRGLKLTRDIKVKL